MDWRKRERMERKALLYACLLERDCCMDPALALATAMGAYGLGGETVERPEPCLSKAWRQARVLELASSKPGTDTGKSATQERQQYRKKEKESKP